MKTIAGRVLARLGEELADAGGAEAGEHLDERRRRSRSRSSRPTRARRPSRAASCRCRAARRAGGPSAPSRRAARSASARAGSRRPPSARPRTSSTPATSAQVVCDLALESTMFAGLTRGIIPTVFQSSQAVRTRIAKNASGQPGRGEIREPMEPVPHHLRSHRQRGADPLAEGGDHLLGGREARRRLAPSRDARGHPRLVDARATRPRRSATRRPRWRKPRIAASSQTSVATPKTTISSGSSASSRGSVFGFVKTLKFFFGSRISRPAVDQAGAGSPRERGRAGAGADRAASSPGSSRRRACRAGNAAETCCRSPGACRDLGIGQLVVVAGGDVHDRRPRAPRPRAAPSPAVPPSRRRSRACPPGSMKSTCVSTSQRIDPLISAAPSTPARGAGASSSTPSKRSPWRRMRSSTTSIVNARRVERLVDLVPAQRRRDGRARTRPHRVHRSDRLALAVLVRVDQDTAPLGLRPLRRHETAVRARERAGDDLAELARLRVRVAPLDGHEHVHARRRSSSSGTRRARARRAPA